MKNKQTKQWPRSLTCAVMQVGFISASGLAIVLYALLSFLLKSDILHTHLFMEPIIPSKRKQFYYEQFYWRPHESSLGSSNVIMIFFYPFFSFSILFLFICQFLIRLNSWGSFLGHLRVFTMHSRCKTCNWKFIPVWHIVCL